MCACVTVACVVPQGTGEAKCANPSLSWRSDSHVYGGTGSAMINSQGDRGCNTRVSTAGLHTAHNRGSIPDCICICNLPGHQLQHVLTAQ